MTDETGGAKRASALRIGLGLLAGWAVSTAIFGGLGYGAFQLLVEDPYSAAEQARFAFLAIAAALLLFTLTLAPSALVLLLRDGRRGVLAFALAGAVAGAVAGALLPLAMGDATNGPTVITLALAGLIHLLVARAVGGIRR